MLLRLAVTNFLQRKVRFALTVAAIALSVSLVVSVTSCYASLEAAVYKAFAQSTGATDVQFSAGADSHGGLDETLVDDIRADPAVREVYGRLEERRPLLGLKGEALDPPQGFIVGVRRDRDPSLEALQLSAGNWFGGARGDSAVVDEGAALHMGAKLHDNIFLSGLNGTKELNVIGIVHKPGALVQSLQTIYVPLETLQQFENMPGKISRVLVTLKDSRADADFAARWKPRLLQIDPKVHVRLASESRREMARQMRGFHALSYMGGLISMLAATFIIFSSLSMGVMERSRTLAMLRAIGTFRLQLALLVMIEGILLAAAGIAIGVPLGILWIHAVAWKFPQLFYTAGVIISAEGIMLGALASMLSALLASLLPAWNATRVSPLEALAPQATPPRKRNTVYCAIAGLLLISIDPLVLFGPSESLSHLEWVRTVKFYNHFVLGVPGVFIGFFLLAPLFVQTIERLAAPVLARLLGIQPALLRQQLSEGVWRAAGTCAALMVGLATLVVMQTQGRALMNAWHLPDNFPDIFIASAREINPADEAKIAGIDGIKPGHLLPVAMPVAALAEMMFSMPGVETSADRTVFFGVDPDLAMRMIELDFRDPNGHSYPKDQQPRLRADAAAKLKQGGYILVTQEFQALKGLHAGDTLALQTPHGIKNYKIAGVVWTPGMDVFQNQFDAGAQFERRAAGSVFGSMDDAKKDFDLTGVHLFAADLNGGIEKEELIGRIRAQISPWGLSIFDVRHIKANIEQTFLRILNLVSTVAYAAMAVAALGVANTIMASIRSRRWQLGVLRSIGVTRGQVFRMLLAEALLLGIIGAAMGLAAGLEMSLNANGLSRNTIGIESTLQPPWVIIFAGATAIVAVSLLASILPALSAAMSKPLTLLSAGRAAA